MNLLENNQNNVKEDCWDSKPTSGFDGYGHYHGRKLSHDEWSYCALSCDELAKSHFCSYSWNNLHCLKGVTSVINVRDTCKMSCNHEDCQGKLKCQGHISEFFIC